MFGLLLFERNKSMADYLALKLARMLSIERPLVSGILKKSTIHVKVMTQPNTMNTYWLMMGMRMGKMMVRSRPESQLTRVVMAMAVLLACCGNTSAVYRKGMGPRPMAKQTMNIRMQAMLMYG